MTWQNSAITITTLLPIVGALGVLLVPKGDDRLVKGIGIGVTGVCLALAIAIAATYDYSATCAAPPCLQFVLNVAWIPVIGARYHVGIDGISMPLYVLTFLLGFLCAIYTGRYVPEPGRIKAFVALTLLLITGMAGTFVAFDLILFFVFWELVLVPMYFLIGVWGSANRQYASIKFFLYTLLGSVFMLLGFLALYFSGPVDAAGKHTFDLAALTAFGAGGGFTHLFQLVVFGAIALGFAVKVPMWPFHTWLPDAHTEAPTIGSVLLAGVMLKMGTYGFVRIALPVLPQGAVAYAPWIGGLAAIAIVYAALACLAQKDLKRLIAFSSVGHMGFVMLGIATLTTIGIQAAIFAIVAIASLGLPGLAGFWGEVMALLGSFSPNTSTVAGLNVGLFRAFMILGGIGTILTAGYFLWMLQRVNMGLAPERWKEHGFRDILTVEWVSWVPLLVLILVLGLIPNIVLNSTEQGVNQIVRIFGG
jgi:NADH-quinone oxidoreductase subunit M